jgi:hypothetical protein
VGANSNQTVRRKSPEAVRFGRGRRKRESARNGAVRRRVLQRRGVNMIRFTDHDAGVVEEIKTPDEFRKFLKKQSVKDRIKIVALIAGFVPIAFVYTAWQTIKEQIEFLKYYFKGE